MKTSIQTWCKQHSLVAFFVLSYGLAWMVWIPTGMLAPNLVPSLALLGAWAPSASALLLTAVIGGKAGLREWLRRALYWRAGIQWYGFVLFGVALIGTIAIALYALLGGAAPQPNLPPGVPLEQWPIVLPILFLSNVFIGGPIAEEFGWRGFALPRLQARISALPAGLAIGVVWGLWHLPFYLFPEGAAVVGHIPFGWYLLLVTAQSVLFTWVYNHTEGSVLMMILFHAAINTTLGSLGISKTSEGSGLIVLNVALTWVAVAVIAAVFGPATLTRKDAVESAPVLS